MKPPFDSMKRRALPGALMAVFGAASGFAHAVYESPDHVGQALIYPYYTVQSANGNAFNTYLSVVNNTARTKALKVRFREGRNGREALSFNLFLSPNDVWTAAIAPADAAAASPAAILTADKSCTAPILPAGGMAFNNFNYTGAASDGGAGSLDRTREGYFEIIEMGALTGTAALSATHNSAGIPNNCAFFQSFPGSVTPPLTSASVDPPTGGLSGTYVLINVANGQSFSGNATALAQFSATSLYTAAGSDSPTLASANPPYALLLARTPYAESGPGLLLHGATYANGRDAVSATLMRAALYNEYVLDPATRSATDWVVTFPTKHLYVAPGSGAAIAPFSSNFGTSGACEPISFAYFNREEAGPPDPCGGGCGVLPPAPPSPPLCWSASVVSVGGADAFTAVSAVFGSTNAIARSVNGAANGWVSLSFTGANAAIAGLTSVVGAARVRNLSTGAVASSTTELVRGLPAIGFMARTLNNGLLNCTTFGGAAGVCAGSYGALVDHRHATLATPAP